MYDCNHIKTKAAEMLLPDTTEPDSLPPLAGVAPRTRVVLAGGMLFHKGDSASGIFILLEGAVRLVRVTPDGAAVTLHLVRPGEMFAEASLFSRHYHCDAIADADSVVGLYPQSKLTAQLRRDPEALWNLARELAQRLQDMRQRYELKQIRSASERVLQFIRLRCDAAGHFRVTGTLKDVATELGLTHEALYRTLARLERLKRISRLKDGLCLMDKGRPRARERPGKL